MNDSSHKVYQFQPLDQYSLKQRVQIRLYGWLLYVITGIIGMTLKFELQGPDTLDEIFAAYKGPILCGWHDTIFAGNYYFRDRGVIVLTSQSFDAEYAARCAKRFGFGMIRGSSTRGGGAAIVELARMARRGFATFLLADGPRGPRHQVKPGVIHLAKATGRPIIPGTTRPVRCWTLNSWDRMQIPKPFSRVVVIREAPIYIAADADEAELQKKQAELQQTLDELTQRAVDWCEQNSQN